MAVDDENRVVRMARGAAAARPAVQGWALRDYPPTGGPQRPVDLVFLHGMSAADWLWPPAWLSRFTAQGYRCRVLALPGREGGATLASDSTALEQALTALLEDGEPERALELIRRSLPGAALIDGPRLADFTDALEAALRQAGRPSVVVAHSLGGAVAQNLIRRGQRAAGTVLLCSVPPYGMWRASAEMALRDPELWLSLARFTLLGRHGTDMAPLRRALFPGGDGRRSFPALTAGLRDESLMAMLEAGGLTPFAPLPGPRPDVVVVGGSQDAFVRPTDVALTAFYYGGLPLMLPQAGHLPMQQPRVADACAGAILGWLADREAPMARAG